MLSVTSIQRWSSCSKIQNLFLSVTNRTSSSLNTHTNNVYRFIKGQEQKFSEEILVEEWLLPLTRHIPNCLQLYNGDCIAVGCQRLMSPDALQPKAYCMNPDLLSFLLAPPGVSTRDPSSERRTYLDEKWPMNLA